MSVELWQARRSLGRTGLRVSPLALGTVSLGVDYGIAAPGEFGRPSDREAIALLRGAADAGINLFDTAPTYGEAERLVGRALGSDLDCILATKVTVPKDLRGTALVDALETSILSSMKALGRDTLDLVQIHNATVETLEYGEVAAYLQSARQRGLVRHLGASVYTEPEALAVIACGAFDLLQVAYNLLDQRMAAKVFPAAEQAGVAILSRSAYFKGVLTSKAQWLPDSLQPLREAAGQAMTLLAGSWEDLPATAMRFCLAEPAIASVLVGPRTLSELDQALAAQALGPLDTHEMGMARGFALQDPALLDPTKWPVA